MGVVFAFAVVVVGVAIAVTANENTITAVIRIEIMRFFMIKPSSFFNNPS
jgi:hypothetical protein